MVPPLFVMWDKVIKKSLGYGEFMLATHEFAVFLRDQLAPEEARSDIDGYLEHAIGYPVRKPLARYIDEYNWSMGHSGHEVGKPNRRPSSVLVVPPISRHGRCRAV
jgi:hypothetical protein